MQKIEYFNAKFVNFEILEKKNNYKSNNNRFEYN